MNLRGKRVYTGRMQLFNGWEIRPFAIQDADGAFLPWLAARKHEVGNSIKEYCFDNRCMNKEEAFELAMARGRGLVMES